MTIRGLISVIALILISWLALELFNFVHGSFGFSWTVGLIIKCLGIAVVGGCAGIGIALGSLPKDQPRTAMSVLPYVSVAPFVALVHFANYILGAPIVPIGMEIVAMGAGALIVFLLLSTLETD